MTEHASQATPTDPSPSGDDPTLLARSPHPITILVRCFSAIVLLLVYALLLMPLVQRERGPSIAAWLLWAAVVVALLRAAIEFTRWRGRRYTLTSSMICATDGILRRRLARVPLDRIQHVVLSKSVAERVFGLGTIGVSHAGGAGSELLWIGIARPREVVDSINQVRRTRGLSGEVPLRAGDPKQPGESAREGVDHPSRAGGQVERDVVTGVPTNGASGAAAGAEPRDEADAGQDASRGAASGTSPTAARGDAPGPMQDAAKAPTRVRPAGRAGVDRALVIGLAGGIGSGKSMLARALEELGAAISDSDREARALLQHEDVRREILGWWGARVLTTAVPQREPAIDRGAVASIVFADPVERKRLEGLIHPRLKAGREALKREAWENGIEVVVIDAPLLFEAGLEGECDEVWFVDTPREVRLARVLASRGWDEAELTRREAAQMDVEAKRLLCTRIVPNDGDEADLRHFVREALEGAKEL